MNCTATSAPALWRAPPPRRRQGHNAMELLGRYSAWLEVYSIDEAFLGVTGTPDELTPRLGHTMKTAVRR